MTGWLGSWAVFPEFKVQKLITPSSRARMINLLSQFIKRLLFSTIRWDNNFNIPFFTPFLLFLFYFFFDIYDPLEDLIEGGLKALPRAFMNAHTHSIRGNREVECRKIWSTSEVGAVIRGPKTDKSRGCVRWEEWGGKQKRSILWVIQKAIYWEVMWEE
jgi:hypothetical protein